MTTISFNLKKLDLAEFAKARPLRSASRNG